MPEERIPPCPWVLTQSQRFAPAGPHVVVLDENARVAHYAAFLEAPETTFVTNRWTVLEEFEGAGARVAFSDLDLATYPAGSVSAVFFRVAKEKALVHHVINSSARMLADGGTLHICGLRREGIKTYIEKAGALFQGKKHVKTTRVGARCGVLTKRGKVRPADLLPDDDYTCLRPVGIAPELTMHTKPGIFGWRKEDPGSALLASVADIPSGCSVLDLGCGYGYLAIRASQKGAAEVWATDSNAAAISACQHNYKAFGVSGEVLAGDCGDTVERTFDIVLCNPPFHEGFQVSSELTGKFLGAIVRLLDAKGVAFVVVNSFIMLEKAAKTVFTDIDTVTDNGKFKVVRLTQGTQPCTT
ncbi:MAG: class I SAM-dependent methyltransferase [Lentisphaerae bacterium]|jgi:16S rRNA (guanine1207-N2)-methyltransferase|nr:class I SAM-dependent methyltransferase [Lentisphaerota bacterium]MBT4814259.1 class I SAM-dependent methyltransferase [Lentisphaerota bacterium]MBT5610965.1 class I SAM-dependent methyltransferase [Lentisphaerota bacterium]MBT7058066.1 class I SAM-dependent methyltransferase [Lentisphaerota bacterium]MBT7848061.1 class I SAM-dependent methyltransferase [Lentisphaerota bacterium]